MRFPLISPTERSCLFGTDGESAEDRVEDQRPGVVRTPYQTSPGRRCGFRTRYRRNSR
jgi:hypothetical protein